MADEGRSVLMSTLEPGDGASQDLAVLTARVVRKLDFILLPFLALLFLFNSLDRSNVGNAETADFTKDIGLQPQNLNTAIEIFFVFFVALQPVGAALGRKYGMSHWVIPCMAIWGVCTALHAFITQKWQLYLLRATIGILEAGFYPTAVAYLSLFYTKYEFARRLGVFYGQYCIAGAFGGTLSYFVFSAFPQAREPSTEEWKSWQVLFCLEGLSTTILAAIGYFWLPRNARTAWFLRADERWWAERRIEADQQAFVPGQDEEPEVGIGEHDFAEQEALEAQGLLHTAPTLVQANKNGKMATTDRGLSTSDVVEAMLDWKLWYLLACNMLSAVPVTAFSLFLPLVLKPLTSSAAQANLLTAPPYLMGGAVLFGFSYWSDTSRQRIKPILWSLALLMLGLSGVVALPNAVSTLRYLFLCILLSGTFVASPLTIAWFTSNMPEPGKRSIVLGINGWGNLAGVLSSMIFQPKYAPDYTQPFFITLALVLLAFLGFVYFRRLIEQENQHRRTEVRHWTSEQIAAEISRGQGPAVRASRGIYFLQMIARHRNASSIKRVVDEMSAAGRRGDDRMTFQYGV